MCRMINLPGHPCTGRDVGQQVHRNKNDSSKSKTKLAEERITGNCDQHIHQIIKRSKAPDLGTKQLYRQHMDGRFDWEVYFEHIQIKGMPVDKVPADIIEQL